MAPEKSDVLPGMGGPYEAQRSSRAASDDSTSSLGQPVCGPEPGETLCSKTWRHLNASVRPCLLVEIELLILTFCTGLQDAISFPDFHCFTSNQTGNTVFLILALTLHDANGETFSIDNIGLALGLFLAGAWLTGQLSHAVGPRRRLWLVGSNLTQTALVAAAAAAMGHGGGGGGVATRAAVALLAAASGSQVVQSRSLSVTEISTAMATAAWVDLVMDARLCARRNRARDRRAAFLAALVLGSLAGAYVYKTAGSAAAVAVSAGGKFLVTVMYLFNGSEKRKVEDAEAGV